MRQTTSYGAAIGLKDLTDTRHLLAHSRFPSPLAVTSVGPGGLPFWGELLFSMPSSGCGHLQFFHLQLKLGTRVSKDHLSRSPEYQTYFSLFHYVVVLPLCDDQSQLLLPV